MLSAALCDHIPNVILSKAYIIKSSPIDVNMWIMLSLLLNPNVIIISDFYCICKFHFSSRDAVFCNQINGRPSILIMSLNRIGFVANPHFRLLLSLSGRIEMSTRIDTEIEWFDLAKILYTCKKN
jgi:hypothetical protein